MTKIPSKNTEFREVIAKDRLEFKALDLAVNLVLTTDVEKSTLKIDPKYDGGATGALWIFNPTTQDAHIILPFRPDMGMIAHECWHCVRRLLRYIGAELDNEVVAYHLGYAVNVVYEFVMENKPGPKSKKKWRKK
jgi:hypothetical protein